MEDKMFLEMHAHNENPRASAEKTEPLPWEQALEYFQRGWNETTSTANSEKGEGGNRVQSGKRRGGDVLHLIPCFPPLPF